MICERAEKYTVLSLMTEARRWLPGRRGFRPTPTCYTDDPVLNDRLRGFDRMEQLNDFVSRHAARRLISTEALGGDAAGWLDGSYVFDAYAAREMAEAIEADVPTFVGKALERALRRDAGDLASPAHGSRPPVMHALACRAGLFVPVQLK